MRLYVDLVGTYTVVSISQIYYSVSEQELRFCTVDGEWFKLSILDASSAFTVLSNLLVDGIECLTNYTAYPFVNSDYLEV